MRNIINNTFEKYGIDNMYNTYIEYISGIHYDSSDGIQLIYILDGEVSIFSNDPREKYIKGELILLNRSDIKYIYSDSINTYVLILNIKDNYLENKNTIYRSNKFINHINHLYNASDLRNLIIEVYKLSLELINRQEILNKLEKILNILIEDYIDKNDSVYNNDDIIDYINKIKLHLDNSELSELSLEKISKKMYLSSPYISTIFSEFSNMTFSQYLQQYRLYIASKYLIKTSKNIEEISFKVGFKSSKSLNTIFRKYLNITPSSFRNKYRIIEEDKKFDYKNIFDHLESLDSSGYKDMYEIKGLNKHIVNSHNIMETKKINWRIIRSLNTFGYDYIYKLRKFFEELKIEAIILKFYIENGIITVDNESVYISNRQIADLMTLLMEYNVIATINISLSEKNWEYMSLDSIEKEMKKNLDSLFLFYKTIRDSIGYKSMRKFKYTINISNIENYYLDQDKLSLYIQYIIKQQRMISEFLSTKKYIFGYDIGNINDEKIQVLRQVYSSVDIQVYIPSYISLAYKLDKEEEIKSISDSKRLKENLKLAIDNLTYHLDIFKEKFTYIYVRDLFKFIDLTDIPEDYKDIFAILLISETLFYKESKYNYIFEYSMLDNSKLNKSYYPRLENQYGFRTPIYWMYKLINKMKGEYIYIKRNLVVTKDKEDYYILVFGSSIIDYLFARKHNFENLEKFNNKVSIKIKDIKGRYKVSEEILTYENTSLENLISGYENITYMDKNDVEYITNNLIPRFKLNIVELENGLDDEIFHSPFNIILKKYVKLS